MAAAWMVRAGKGGYVIDEFLAKNCVAIGWEELGDLSGVRSKDEIAALIDEEFAQGKKGTRRVYLLQVNRFRFEMKEGDPVVTYNSDTREYSVGEITGGYSYEPDRVEDHPNVRPVKWTGKVSRDDLSVSTRNTLGAILTLFDLGEEAWEEVSARIRGEPLPPVIGPDVEDEELTRIREEVLGRSHEFIKDRLQRLSWDEMQDLVAGVLRAMGYKTRVSPAGSDRGKDIVASPDGLGLKQPRIRVEVKHRPKQQMGAPGIRSFIGALRQNDKGLYVSTGGFSKEAHYEAERATVPVTLIDLDDLVALLIQQYESLDTEARALMPLMKVYWPAV